MKRTSPLTLVLSGVIGVAAGFIVDQILTSAGRATFVPTVMLPLLLVLLGAADIILAWPVQRATRGIVQVRVNPFRALRIAMLAKASSILGAAIGGFALGLVLFLSTRPVTPSVGSWGVIIATAVCGGVLVVAGLVAEHMCTIRKDDHDDEQPGAGDSEPHAHSH
ncbi:DUF3180 domain-containing protein [Microbacterium candidum]|uniref:DUF3180 domain-containing protein n=1 Tax=Microbacterium candidum TaxID=3041922 RepID=A0ABT7MUW7_9MICO|nr:DUF3180 domain-containing protein [Microbacterium sp. ASV49]MDL9978251.1 DUF3180 domain-containing protein [Microbacterium sp. ASV49]